MEGRSKEYERGAANARKAGSGKTETQLQVLYEEAERCGWNDDDDYDTGYRHAINDMIRAAKVPATAEVQA